LDIADDTFVVAEASAVAAVVADPASWSRWWPDLTLQVHQDRGAQGMRWTVAGPVPGSMEIWLEPWGDGVLVHYYLRLAPATGGPGRSRRLRRRRTQAWKQHAFALKDRLERGREVGRSRAGAAAPVTGPEVKPAEERAEST
jgi:hypothetical protein